MNYSGIIWFSSVKSRWCSKRGRLLGWSLENYCKRIICTNLYGELAGCMEDGEKSSLERMFPRLIEQGNG